MTSPSTDRLPVLDDDSLVLLGLSTAGPAGRGLALGPDDVVRVRDHIGRTHPDVEHVVVVTCDRTELVVARPAGIDVGSALRLWHDALGIEFRGAHAACLSDDARPFVLRGRDAVEHVMRVAAGLESSLVGDVDVLGQLRQAFNDATGAESTGPLTRRVFRDAFAVGRRARSRTDISVGGAGVGSAVADAVGRPDHEILLVGAGPAGRTIARRLAKTAGRRLVIANRTSETAQTLASEVGARTVEYTALDDALVRAGTIVTAVAAPSPILTAQRLSELRRHRPGWSPTIIDVGAPPNVEPTAGFDVVGLDGLAARTTAVADRRLAAVPAVEQLVADALERRYPITSPPSGSSPASLTSHHSAGTTCRSIAQRKPVS